MGDKPTMVIGRVVSMERGRPTIAVPLGPAVTNAELMAAARNWKKVKDDPAQRAQALSRLMTAAENL